MYSKSDGIENHVLVSERTENFERRVDNEYKIFEPCNESINNVYNVVGIESINMTEDVS